MVRMEGGPHDGENYVVPAKAEDLRVDGYLVPLYASADGIVVKAIWAERRPT